MYVSLISGGAGYLKGAIALGRSMQRNDPQAERLLLIEEGAYNNRQIDYATRKGGWKIKMVDPVRPPPCDFKAERWPQTFTKLHVWGVDAERIVYVDADCLVVQPSYAKLIGREFENIAACWVARGSTRFNAGMMVLDPDRQLADELIYRIQNEDPKKTDAAGSDQSYLNLMFPQWTQLPDKFNYRWWERPPGDLHIAHIRPHPWTNRIGSRYHSQIKQKWKNHLGPLQ